MRRNVGICDIERQKQIHHLRHIIRQLARKVPPDFTPAGVRARWQSGYADALRMIEREPWTEPVDAMEGVVVHQAV
ncbi:MAG TPA: DUF3734 domain-containing protein [Burkholderiaceae bacterium]|nr:DUF3734 domain-containing protein [Burkholderiaceae bacterium]